jgi:Concanavalin A-like lectin/glucanases superfamily/FlgD Ig-like domain
MKRPLSRPLLFVFIAILSFLFESFGAAPELVAYWSFDSVSGNTYYDVTGHGYDAVGSGTGLSVVPGLIGQALNCSDSTFDCAVQNSKDSFALNTFTVESWYNATTLPLNTQAKILDYGFIASGVRNGFSLLIKDQGFAELGVSSINGNLWLECASSTKITAGKWYHIAGTYDGSFIRIYVNGALEDSLAYSGGILKAGSDARIGCQKLMNGAGASFANGKIDELKFYNYVLSSSAISDHYHAINPAPVLLPYTPNPTYNQEPQLRWHSDKAIAIYRFQIATNRQFSSLIASIPTADTFFTPTVELPYGVIYWRVGNDSDSFSWSLTSSVTIQDPAIPILIPYVPNPTINRNPQVSWYSVKSSTSYTIQIDTTPVFTSPLVVNPVSDTHYMPLVNLPVAEIYWRVKSNLSSTYSLTDSFTIQNDSIPFIIKMFPDTQHNARPAFYWHPGVGASSYRIQIDTTGNFLDPYISVPVADTVYKPTVDIKEGRIFWRVSANAVTGRYSAVDTFWIRYPGSVKRSSHGSTVSATLRRTRQGASLTYSLDKAGRVALGIYSITGVRVAFLNWENEAAGAYSVAWNGTDQQGGLLPAGAYCAVCRINGKTFSDKIILTR